MGGLRDLNGAGRFGCPTVEDPSTPFKDISKLSPDYVPERLVNREEEFRKLVVLFKPLLEGGTSQRVLIHGPGGSGKTALALRFGRELESAAGRRGLKLDFVHADCREDRTQFQVAWRLSKIYGLSLPSRGRSTCLCLDSVASRLEENDSRLVLVLDWLDFQLRRGGSDLLYLLTRLWEDLDGQNRISVIATSRSPDPLRFVDAATRSTFMHNRVRMDQYSGSELREILRERSKEAFKPGAIEWETVELISKDATWEDGAGFAIEWLRQAGIAATERADRTVTPRHALEAKVRVHSALSGGMLQRLEPHELFILSALTRKLKALGRDFVSTGQLEEEYRSVCEMHGVRARSHPKFLELVKGLSDFGVIDLDLTSIGPGITHAIGLSKGPVEALESTLRLFLRM